jgi:hypothetical protein
MDGKEMDQARCYFYLLHIASEKGCPLGFVTLRFGQGNFVEARLCAVAAFIQGFPVELVGYYGLFLPPPSAARVNRGTKEDAMPDSRFPRVPISL